MKPYKTQQLWTHFFFYKTHIMLYNNKITARPSGLPGRQAKMNMIMIMMMMMILISSWNPIRNPSDCIVNSIWYVEATCSDFMICRSNIFWLAP